MKYAAICVYVVIYHMLICTEGLFGRYDICDSMLYGCRKNVIISFFRENVVLCLEICLDNSCKLHKGGNIVIELME